MDPLRTLVERLDTTDPATAAHGRAVALWCSRITASMRLSRDEQNWIVRSAQLHDVGKLCLPPDLLRAPRVLTDDERALMRNHVFDGERLLAECGLLEYRGAVMHHHERYDGRGYPDGLSGDAIPLPARIVAVADAYDAMTGPRPYRFPMTPDRALLEIERMRGTQFDPTVVEVMLAIVGDALRPVAV
jgi:HD-GYP domain-containing protein (c-di-GMP phosphodiesterase class II)